LKARNHDPARSVEVCEELEAEDKGTLLQRDTYFEVPRGRLKLREEPNGVAHLIAYERPDTADHKESRYRLIEVGDPVELKNALAGALGVTVVVSKVRRLFIFEGVRIHIDQVDELGDFIEFEGVATDGGNPGSFAELLDSLRGSFGIGDGDLVPASYSDLLLRSAGPS
jgi:adenylate cyclase class 2